MEKIGNSRRSDRLPPSIVSENALVILKYGALMQGEMTPGKMVVSTGLFLEEIDSLLGAPLPGPCGAMDRKSEYRIEGSPIKTDKDILTCP